MIRPRNKPRPGRLKGTALIELRIACYMRDKGLCQRCGKGVVFDMNQECADSFHMAHRRNKRMWGDTLENVQTECGACHRQYHAQGPSMTKPVPPKEVSR